MSTAIVGSVIANKPFNAGNAWMVLGWVRGLQRLGFDVYLAEELEPQSCVDTAGRPAPFDASANLAYFKLVSEWFGLEGRAALTCGARHHGVTSSDLSDVADGSELLVNISGHLTAKTVRGRARREVFVDLDPGYTQMWHAEGTGARLDGHDAFFTVGTNVARPGFAIPANGIHWQPVRPPVVLDDWPQSSAGEPHRFTTVASWRGAFGAAQFGGRVFGVKAHQFRRFAEVPRRCGQSFELALEIHAADHNDVDLLEDHGWQLRDPREAVPDPRSFRDYVAYSGAEFSVAQGIYVDTHSGWFSDRTVRYLASGKPALVQDTGFGDSLPVGEGLLAFRTVEDAVEGSRRIAEDYGLHAAAARRIAEDYFDSHKVLGDVLERSGVAP